MGATGLDFNYGTHDDMIIGNVFTDLAGIGVSIGKFTKDSTLEYHVAYTPTDPMSVVFMTPFEIIIFIMLRRSFSVVAASPVAIHGW